MYTTIHKFGVIKIKKILINNYIQQRHIKLFKRAVL